MYRIIKKIFAMFILLAFVIGCGSTTITTTIMDDSNSPTAETAKEKAPLTLSELITDSSVAESDWDSEGIVKLESEENINILSLDSDDGKAKYFRYNNLKPSEINSKYIQWVLKTKENFALFVTIETNNGERHLIYKEKDTGKGKVPGHNETPYIINGVGSDAVDGEWHKYTRDIESDLKRYEPDAKLVGIKSIAFNGFSAKLAQMKLYDVEKSENINKVVKVSAPGIVLTFDDSYVDNWNKFMPEFKKNDVVVTFFCHKWASGEDITESEAALLKTFITDGHEIGYHTKDHESTNDTKYSIYESKEQKAKAYFDDQIAPGVKNMKSRGFNPKSFSYPYISGTPAHNKIIKKALPHIREFFAHVYVMDEKPTVGSKTIDELKSYLDKFKEDKEIGVFLGHGIDDATISNYTSAEKIKEIIRYAKEIGLKFYTLEEAHRIYTRDR
ncbi:MAG: polysaccharide deacetylase family protein [Sulfurovum sp.]|nr:polysaccharide deacetylase family protein [Sulfurovum sp.]